MTATVYASGADPTEEETARFVAAARSYFAGDRAVAYMHPEAQIVYLSGVANAALDEHLHRPDLGVLIQPGTTSYLPRYRGRVGLDNGCFARGSTFDAEAWFGWLGGVVPAHVLWAVLPDVYGDHEATVERSAPRVERVRDLGIPTAVVAQDGATAETFPWEMADAVFIGGTDPWKLGPVAASIARAGRRRGRWVHMGKVNSARRLRYAAWVGCDSADGTFIRFGRQADMVDRVLDWVNDMAGRLDLRA